MRIGLTTNNNKQNHKLWEICMTAIVRIPFKHFMDEGGGGWGNFDASNNSVVLLEVICLCLRHQRKNTHILLEICGSCTDTRHTRAGRN